MLSERQGTTCPDRTQVLVIWGILVMACCVLKCQGSALPPLDSAFSLPTEKFRSLKNCTDKHCQMIYQLTFDEIRRIALIRLAVLEKIHSRLHPEEAPTTAQLPSGEPTSPPETSTTPSPVWLFDDIVTFAEKPDLGNPPDYNVVKFKVGNQKAKGRLEVKRADLWILMRMKRPSSKGKPRPRSFRKRRGKRVHLKISTVKEPLSRKSRDVKGGKIGQVLTEARLRVKKSQWQKFGMPLNMIQAMLDDPEQSLSLRVDCKGCGKKVVPVLLYRRQPTRRSMRKGGTKKRKRKLSKKRPLLVIHTRTKNTRTSPAS